MPCYTSNMKICVLRKLKELRRNKDGVTAIEFAIIAPTLLMLIMGSLETSLMMYARSIMEGATFQSSRTGKTGYVEAGMTQTETIIAAINDRAGILMDVDNITVTPKSYGSFSEVGEPEPFIDTNGNGVRDFGESYTDINGDGEYSDDMGIDSYGSSAQITMYTITYDWPVFTPVLQPFFGTSRTLTALTVVKNEPY